MDPKETSPNGKNRTREPVDPGQDLFVIPQKSPARSLAMYKPPKRRTSEYSTAPLYIGANDEASKANGLKLKKRGKEQDCHWIRKRYEKSGAVAVHNPEIKPVILSCAYVQ